MSSGMPLRSITPLGELVVARGVLAEALGKAGQLVDRRHLGAGVPDDDVHEPKVVDVLVRQHHQLDVVDRPPVPGELVLELVERAPELGPESTSVSGSSSIR